MLLVYLYPFGFATSDQTLVYGFVNGFKYTPCTCMLYDKVGHFASLNLLYALHASVTYL